MAKKNKIKKIFESMRIESAEANKKLTESVQADSENEAIHVQQGESPASIPNPQDEVMETSSAQEESAAEQSSLSDEPKLEGAESVAADQQNEATLSDEIPQQEELEATSEDQESSVETVQPPADETSTEDVLDNVRRSLIEAESETKQKESKWWRRIGRKGKKAESEQPPVNMEIDLPIDSALADLVKEPKQRAESKE
ncbi:MAG TPA: hypothetical protein VK206_12985, partial [Anaerolineales bacterium]|nr:hypothetical protein [Anaerolineales bacterium]